MATAFGVKSIRTTIAKASTPQVISPNPLFVDSFRVFCPSANTGSVAVGDPLMTIAASLSTDGEPIAAGEGLQFHISPKTASMPCDFNLDSIYLAGTVAGDVAIITYISKV